MAIFGCACGALLISLLFVLSKMVVPPCFYFFLLKPPTLAGGLVFASFNLNFLFRVTRDNLLNLGFFFFG